MKTRACKRCGCTDAHACEGGCSWIPAPLADVCSRCATDAECDRALAKLKGQLDQVFNRAERRLRPPGRRGR